MKKILFLAFFSTMSCYASDGTVQSYNSQTGTYTVGAIKNLSPKKIDTKSSCEKIEMKSLPFKR